MQFKLMFPKRRGEALIFSLPQSNQYQQVSDLLIQPNNYQVIKQNPWGNEVVIFTLNDVGDRTSLSFRHSGKTVKKSVREDLGVSDYEKELLEKYHYLLTPNRFINGSDRRIKKIIKDLRFKNEDLRSTFVGINNFILDYLTYGKPIEGLYPYTQTIEERTTDCGGFSTLTLSLLQSLNIPARLVVGFLIKKSFFTSFLSNFELLTFNFKLLSMHAWPEALLPDGFWFPFDPSLEWRRSKNQTKRQGGLGFVPNDRLVVSYGQDFTLSHHGKKIHLDILQNPIYST